MSATSMSALLKGEIPAHPGSLPGNRQPDRSKLPDLRQCLPKVTLCGVLPLVFGFSSKSIELLRAVWPPRSCSEDAPACAVVAAEFDAVGTGAFCKEPFSDGTGVEKRVLRKAHGSWQDTPLFCWF